MQRLCAPTQRRTTSAWDFSSWQPHRRGHRPGHQRRTTSGNPGAPYETRLPELRAQFAPALPEHVLRAEHRAHAGVGRPDRHPGRLQNVIRTRAGEGDTGVSPTSIPRAIERGRLRLQLAPQASPPTPQLVTELELRLTGSSRRGDGDQNIRTVTVPALLAVMAARATVLKAKRAMQSFATCNDTTRRSRANPREQSRHITQWRPEHK